MMIPMRKSIFVMIVCEFDGENVAVVRVLILGIASLLMFPEDESGESSQQEEEESEGAETDEHDPSDDYALTDEQLERRRLVFFLFLHLSSFGY